MSLLVASAAKTQPATSLLAQLVASALVEEVALFSSLEDFVEHRPDMAWVIGDATETLVEIDRLVGQNMATTGPLAIWPQLTANGRRLLAGAVAIARRLQIDEAEVAVPLRVVLRGLNHVR